MSKDLKTITFEELKKLSMKKSAMGRKADAIVENIGDYADRIASIVMDTKKKEFKIYWDTSKSRW